MRPELFPEFALETLQERFDEIRRMNTLGIEGESAAVSARKAAAFIGVVALHGIVFLAIAKLSPPRTRQESEFAGSVFLVEPRKRKVEKPKEKLVLPNRAVTESVNEIPREAFSTVPLAIPSSVLPSTPSIDWASEREHAAERRAGREFAEPAERPLLSKPKAMELPKVKPEHKRGDTQRFDDGEIRTWVNDKCYVTNREPPTPRLDPKSINVECRLNGRPPIEDGFDHVKPAYLRKEGEEIAKPKSLFSGETVACNYSSTVCEIYER